MLSDLCSLCFLSLWHTQRFNRPVWDSCTEEVTPPSQGGQGEADATSLLPAACLSHAGGSSRHQLHKDGLLCLSGMIL